MSSVYCGIEKNWNVLPSLIAVNPPTSWQLADNCKKCRRKREQMEKATKQDEGKEENSRNKREKKVKEIR